MTCDSIVRVREGKAKSSDRNAVKEFLGKMAMNPSDRSRTQIGPGGAVAHNQSDATQAQNPFEQIAEEVRNQSPRVRPN